MRILVLLDDKPGNRSQALGVAERLAESAGATLENLEIRGSRLADLPSFALGAHLWGYDGESRRLLRQRRDAPDVLIAAGRRLIPALRHLKARFPAARLVYLMHPKRRLKEFDLLAIPEHDRPRKRRNVLVTLGSVHRVRAEKLRAQGEAYASLPHPRIAVLVGGRAKGAHYKAADWMRLAAQLNALAARTGGRLLITTSRRTGEAATALLRDVLPSESVFHAWQPEGENPYFAMLGAADAVVATGESMSMLSEACALGVPVFVFNPERRLGRKHRRLQRRLIAQGYARALTDDAMLDWIPPAPLDEAGRVAEAILAMIR